MEQKVPNREWKSTMKEGYVWIKNHAAVISVVIALFALIFSVMTVIAPSFTWYRDSDGDNYGDPNQHVWRPWQPDGYVKNNGDCYDNNKEVHPGQDKFFAKDRGDGSFDYNCNDGIEKEFADRGQCINTGDLFTDATAKIGWSNEIPAPGEEGKWLNDCDKRVVFQSVGGDIPFLSNVRIIPRIILKEETEQKKQKGR